MPRNGSGVYTLPSGNPVVSGTTISSTWANNTLSDIATALTGSLTKDGQTTPTANIPMGGFKLTGLGSGTADGNSLRFEQLFSQGAPTDIASAATTDIGAVRTNFLTVTGTTSITSLGTNYNGPKMLRFSGILTLTYNATTLLTPGSANIVTGAGDTCIAIPKSTVNGVADGWNIVSYQRGSGIATDFLNTTRIGVASATTTDLTANAPNTRNIQITGTTTITSFTVAIGQLYFVQFAAALTLTNNAAIVTNTGANITTSAGDTCIIRATAANTVEVLSYSYAGIVPNASITPAKLSQPFTRATPQATTSGTTSDYTGLPSWVTVIIASLSGVSTNGSADLFLRPGSGSFPASGFLGGSSLLSSGVTTTNQTTGISLTNGSGASNVLHGNVMLVLEDPATFKWAYSGVLAESDTTRTATTGGSVTLSGVLDRIRLTTSAGTDVFDAGSWVINYW